MIDRQYEKSEVILIGILTIYCVALVVGMVAYVFYEYDMLMGEDGVLNDAVLLHLVVAVGVLASAVPRASSMTLAGGPSTPAGRCRCSCARSRARRWRWSPIFSAGRCSWCSASMSAG